MAILDSIVKVDSIVKAIRVRMHYTNILGSDACFFVDNQYAADGRN